MGDRQRQSGLLSAILDARGSDGRVFGSGPPALPASPHRPDLDRGGVDDDDDTLPDFRDVEDLFEDDDDERGEDEQVQAEDELPLPVRRAAVSRHGSPTKPARARYFDQGGYFRQRSQQVVRAQSAVRSMLAKKKAHARSSMFDHRQAVVQELLETERTYVNALSDGIVCYYTPLHQNRKSSSAYMSAKDLDVVFGRLHVLININTRLLTTLQQRWRDWSQWSLLGDVFLQLGPVFKTYADYIVHYDEAAALVASLRERTPAFNAWLFDVQASGATELSSILIQPVQRIPRYQLLLQDMLLHTPEDHRDYPLLQQAVVAIRETTEYLNSRKRDAINQQKVYVIQKQLEPSKPIVAPHRLYVADDIVNRSRHSHRSAGAVSRNMRLYVLSDLLVWGKPALLRNGRHKYESRQDVARVYVMERDDLAESHPHAFELREMAKPSEYTLVMCRDAAARTALTKAIRKAQVSVFEKSLPTMEGMPIGHVAAMVGRTHLVTLLLDLDPQGTLAALDDTKGSMLHVVAHSGHAGLARLLVARGIDVNARNTHGRTALHVAVMRGRTAVIDALFERVLNASDGEGSSGGGGGGGGGGKGSTKDAAPDNKKGKGKGKMGPPARVGTNATTGSSFLVKRSAGADTGGAAPLQVLINPVDNDGRTPVYEAFMRERWSMVEYLQRLGGDIDIADKSGWALLHAACFVGHMPSVGMLVDRFAADVNPRTRNDRTPLHYALERQHIAVVRFLVLRGAHVNWRDSLSRTPLHMCNGNLARIDFLVQHGARPTLPDVSGNLAIDWLDEENRERVLLVAEQYKSDRTEADAAVTLLPASWKHADSVNHALTDTWVAVRGLANKHMLGPLVQPHWWAENTGICMACNLTLTWRIRPHHCRRCGIVTCDDCSKHRWRLREHTGNTAPARVCDRCHTILSYAQQPSDQATRILPGVEFLKLPGPASFTQHEKRVGVGALARQLISSVAGKARAAATGRQTMSPQQTRDSYFAAPIQFDMEAIYRQQQADAEHMPAVPGLEPEKQRRPSTAEFAAIRVDEPEPVHLVQMAELADNAPTSGAEARSSTRQRRSRTIASTRDAPSGRGKGKHRKGGGRARRGSDTGGELSSDAAGAGVGTDAEDEDPGLAAKFGAIVDSVMDSLAEGPAYVASAGDRARKLLGLGEGNDGDGTENAAPTMPPPPPASQAPTPGPSSGKKGGTLRLFRRGSKADATGPPSSSTSKHRRSHSDPGMLDRIGDWFRAEEPDTKAGKGKGKAAKKKSGKGKSK